MADTIIGNVGTAAGDTRKGIASEATLAALLEVFRTSSGLSDKQLKELQKLGKGYKGPEDKDKDKTSKSFGRISDAADALQSSLRGVPKQFEMFGDILERGAQKPAEALGQSLTKVGNVAETVAGSKVFKYLGGGILAAGIGAVATGFGVLAGYLQNSLDAFQDLSTYGGNFGNSMIDLRKTALQGNLSLQEFTSLVRENSKLFGTIGTNVSEGAGAFTKLSLAVRKFDNYRLREMGYTVSGVNDMLLDYLDVAGKSSNVQNDLNTNQGRVVASAVKFGTELNELSSITGISRKELAKSVKEQAARGEVTAALMRAQDKGIANANEKFTAVTTALTPFGPTVMKAAGDLLAFNGAFVTPESQALQRFVPGLAKTVKRYNQAIMSNTPDIDAGEAFKDNVKGMLDSRKQLIQMSALNTEQGRWAQRFLAEQAPLFAKYGHLQGENLDRQLNLDAAEAKRRQQLGAGLTKLDEVFRNIRSKIEEKIINSKIFEKLAGYLDDVAEYFASPEFEKVFNNLISMFDTGLKYLSNIFTPEGRQLILDDLKNTFNEILYEFHKTWIGSSWYKWLTGMSEEEVNAKLAAVDADKKATEIRREMLKAETEYKDKMKKFDPTVDYGAWLAADARAFNEYKMKIMDLNTQRVKAEQEATEMWKKTSAKSAGQKIQDDLTSTFKKIRSFTEDLFSSEGRGHIINQVVDLFTRVATTIEGVFVRNPITRQFLTDKQLTDFRYREHMGGKESESVALGSELYQKNKELQEKQEQIDKAKTTAEKAALQAEYDKLATERDTIEARKKVVDAEISNLKNLRDFEKEKIGNILKNKEVLEDRTKTNISSLEEKLSLSKDANVSKMTGEQFLKLSEEEQRKIAKEIYPGWFFDPSSIEDMMKNVKDIKADREEISNIGQAISKATTRQMGGPVSKGITFTHDNEYVMSEQMMDILRSTFNTVGAIGQKLNQSDQMNDLLKSTSVSIGNIEQKLNQSDQMKEFLRSTFSNVDAMYQKSIQTDQIKDLIQTTFSAIGTVDQKLIQTERKLTQSDQMKNLLQATFNAVGTVEQKLIQPDQIKDLIQAKVNSLDSADKKVTLADQMKDFLQSTFAKIDALSQKTNQTDQMKDLLQSTITTIGTVDQKTIQTEQMKDMLQAALSSVTAIDQKLTQADRNLLTNTTATTEKPMDTRDAERDAERAKQLADLSKPDQEQYKAIVDSKNILTEIRTITDSFNETFLNLYRQNLDLNVQMQKDIEDMRDYFRR